MNITTEHKLKHNVFLSSDIINSKMRITAVSYNIFNNNIYFVCIIFLKLLRG